MKTIGAAVVVIFFLWLVAYALDTNGGVLLGLQISPQMYIAGAALVVVVGGGAFLIARL